MSKKKKEATLLQEEKRLAYKLLLPTYLILFLIAFYPLFSVFYTSMTNRQFASSQEVEFVGFENYKSLLAMTIEELPPRTDDNGNVMYDEETGEVVYDSPVRVLPREPIRYKEVFTYNFFGKRYVFGGTDPEFLKSIYNTLSFTLLSVALETILGLGVAMVVNSNFRGKGAMRTVMLVPWAVITVVSARMWEWILQSNRTGLFNTVLEMFGVGDGSISFLSQEGLQLPSMIMIDVWKTTPYMALLILAGLQTIPGELYEAAEIDGASKLQQFYKITLPLLKPAIGVALIFRSLDALRVFDVFQVLLGSRKYSMASYNYFQLIGNRNMGLASAIGVVIFVIIFGFAVFFIKSLGVNEEDA